MKRPNILMIIDDQHHAGCFGHAGHPDVKTPVLDQLAAEGTRFHDTFCQNGICVPSRVSYLTGQYCHTHGVYGNDAANRGLSPLFLFFELRIIKYLLFLPLISHLLHFVT